MTDAFICDGVRTPIGRYGGALSSIRADDLAAVPIAALIERNRVVDWAAVDDVILGCANQAGEDNRNVARMASLLAGLPREVGGTTTNRLCGSGLDAVGTAARAIRAQDADILVAGGVESMSRAPFVMPKSESAFARNPTVYDTTIGWRFVNPKMEAQHGIDSMPETAENVAREYQISRADQDAFALRSQQRAAVSQANGRLAREIVGVTVSQRNQAATIVEQDEHPRQVTLEALTALPSIVFQGGTVTAGNSSGINDGAAAMIVASESAAARHGLIPRARIVGMTSIGIEPRIMGIGPAAATEKLLARAHLRISDIGVIELNEAFASQALAVMQLLGLEAGDPRVNPNGGAIALGHPLGMSGARLALTLTEELQLNQARYGIATMCIGVGQGISMLLERV